MKELDQMLVTLFCQLSPESRQAVLALTRSMLESQQEETACARPSAETPLK
jgi:hypothetical protein